MFDSHCHLDFEAILPELDARLEEARAQGVRGWLVPGTCPEQWSQLAHLVRDDVWVAVGLHPWETEREWNTDALMVEFRESALKLGAVALGECGLDKFRGGPIERQIELFEAQLQLAGEMELPVVLHQVGHREAFLRSIERVGLPDACGVVHGFNGDAAWGRALVSRGLLLGVGFSVMYESRKKLRGALREIALDRFLLETDAPDQKPAGADRAGVPADLVAVASAVAQVVGALPSVVAEETEHSARALFGLRPCPISAPPELIS